MGKRGAQDTGAGVTHFVHGKDQQRAARNKKHQKSWNSSGASQVKLGAPPVDR